MKTLFSKEKEVLMLKCGLLSIATMGIILMCSIHNAFAVDLFAVAEGVFDSGRAKLVGISFSIASAMLTGIGIAKMFTKNVQAKKVLTDFMFGVIFSFILILLWPAILEFIRGIIGDGSNITF
ncbi:MAG: hypothetical protein ACRCU3_02755 [Eubacteriaceae bacterium]